MTQDDRMETITDPAEIRATDEPDERGDFPCCTTPASVGAAVALDLDAIEAMVRRGALYDCDALTLTLVAEVRRLTRLGQCDLDLLMRAESAEAEVGTLRARLAEGRRIVGMLAETVESECEDDPDICHEHDRTDDGRCPLLVDLNRAYAALATTGEGQ